MYSPYPAPSPVQAQTPSHYGTRQQGIDFKAPGLVLYGMENGPTVAIQGGRLVSSEGTALPENVQQLEESGIRMGHHLKRAIIHLNTEKRMAAERQASELRLRELQAQEEARLFQMSRETAAVESQKFSLPDIDMQQQPFYPAGPGPSGSYL